MPSLSLKIDRDIADPRAAEIQCTLRIKNESEKYIRLVSLRPSSATGAQIDRLADTDPQNDRPRLDDTYSRLRVLLEPVIGQKLTAADPLPPGTHAINRLMETPINYIRRLFGRPSQAWRLTISDSKDAKSYQNTFIREDADLKDLNSVLDTEIAIAESLERKLRSHLADIEPGVEITRNFVIRCDRRLFTTKSYTIDFDIGYFIKNGENLEKQGENIEKQETPLYNSTSFIATIAPQPFFISLAAAGFSVMGVILKASLDMLKNADPINRAAVEETLFSAPMLLALISGTLTAVFFYNIYEWTELGKKVDATTGVGWRSALIIGGISGLLNTKVVAALEGLFG